MKSSPCLSLRTRGTCLLVGLALLTPALFAGETAPAKPAENSAGSASAKLDSYRNENTELNKAEVKAALERLDSDIKLLSAKIDAIPEPARKQELTQRLKVLKERRSELNREFRKVRYDALVTDVKAEWDQIAP